MISVGLGGSFAALFSTPLRGITRRPRAGTYPAQVYTSRICGCGEKTALSALHLQHYLYYDKGKQLLFPLVERYDSTQSVLLPPIVVQEADDLLVLHPK